MAIVKFKHSPYMVQLFGTKEVECKGNTLLEVIDNLEKIHTGSRNCLKESRTHSIYINGEDKYYLKQFDTKINDSDIIEVYMLIR